MVPHESLNTTHYDGGALFIFITYLVLFILAK